MPLSHRQHRYQSQLIDYMAFSLRSKRLSIPKGEEPGFTASEFSRSFRETRSFDHLAATVSTVSKGEGSQPPSWAPSPGNCPPLAGQALSPGPLRLHLRRQNRGVQNRPGSGLSTRATGAQLRAGAPTRCRERATYTPAAGPAGTRPSFPKPGHSL